MSRDQNWVWIIVCTKLCIAKYCKILQTANIVSSIWKLSEYPNIVLRLETLSYFIDKVILETINILAISEHRYLQLIFTDLNLGWPCPCCGSKGESRFGAVIVIVRKDQIMICLLAWCQQILLFYLASLSVIVGLRDKHVLYPVV